MLNLLAKTLLEIETLDAYQIKFLAENGRIPTEEEREAEQNNNHSRKADTVVKEAGEKSTDTPTINLVAKDDEPSVKEENTEHKEDNK